MTPSLSSSQIRQRFLDFFVARGHAILPSASLVPQNDPSVLFNTAGMQPLVPFLLGEKHPLGNRLASCQKCVRTGDIEEVGNHKNLTFFEMLGNWSLGDYFKEDAIKWSFEFLTSKDEGLGLDPSRLYITVFEGDNDAPRDLEAVEIWKHYIPENRIYFLPKANNWWSPGDNGPCGPDTEMFYDVTEHGLGDMTHEEYVAADDRGDVVEIWNDVFMEYKKENGAVVGKLSQKNVDTGSGLERIAMIVQGKSNVYEADMFEQVMKIIRDLAENYNIRDARIIADHIRAAVFIISDGVQPGTNDAEYIPRKLIRRAIDSADKIKLNRQKLVEIALIVIETNAFHYTNLGDPHPILSSLQREINKVSLIDADKIFEKEFDKFMAKEGRSPIQVRQVLPGVVVKPDNPLIPAQLAFRLYSEKGIPKDKIISLAKSKGYILMEEEFKDEMEKHRELSKKGAQQKFKGGLANTSEITTKLHTAHHLLLKALQEVVSPDIHQKGSNITEERLRLDFNFDRKLTDEEKKKVEDLVNEKIREDLAVTKKEMPKAEAMKLGAEMEFGTTYPDIVSVYMIHDQHDNVFSQEFCGGPHVTRTGDLGVFKIVKEEASSAGVRRIKATLS